MTKRYTRRGAGAAALTAVWAGPWGDAVAGALGEGTGSVSAAARGRGVCLHGLTAARTTCRPGRPRSRSSNPAKMKVRLRVLPYRVFTALLPGNRRALVSEEKRSVSLLVGAVGSGERVLSVGRVIPSANMVFVSVLHSISRIWPAPGQPHFCQGHFPREPGSQRRQHPGRGCSAEGEESGRGLVSAVKKSP